MAADKLFDEQAGLTLEQKKQRAELEQRQTKLQKEMQAALTGLLTRNQKGNVERRALLLQRRANRPPPTHPDVSCGTNERHVMDVWLAKSDRPTPVFFSIHGGGFHSGNKAVGPEILQACLDNGTSVVATGQPYSHQLAAAGGDAAYSWELISDSGLPAGLSLSSSGLLSGSATGDFGTWNIAVQVTDGTGAFKKVGL